MSEIAPAVPDNKYLIVGYGNSLLGDDGFGQVAARILETAGLKLHLPLTTITTIALGPELIPVIRRAEIVVFIDITRSLPAGDLACIELTRRTASGPSYPLENLPEPLATSLASSHNCDPTTLLKMTEALYDYCPESRLYTVGGKSFALGEELSQPVLEAIPSVSNAIIIFLAGKLAGN